MVSINSTGGIFLRLDSSGNLNIYDTTGTTVVKIIGGLVSGKLNRGTQVTNATITTTTSTTNVALGVSNQFTPQVSGSCLVLATYSVVSNNTVNGISATGINQATGSLNPAGGASPDGSGVFTGLNVTSATVNAGSPVTYAVLITGLTIGTAVTFEMVGSASSTTTAKFLGPSISVIEV